MYVASLYLVPAELSLGTTSLEPADFFRRHISSGETEPKLLIAWNETLVPVAWDCEVYGNDEDALSYRRSVSKKDLTAFLTECHWRKQMADIMLFNGLCKDTKALEEEVNQLESLIDTLTKVITENDFSKSSVCYVSEYLYLHR